jgi:hypothetical protein
MNKTKYIKSQSEKFKLHRLKIREQISTCRTSKIDIVMAQYF